TEYQERLSDLHATEEPSAEAGHADHPGSSRTAARHRGDVDDRGEDVPRHQLRQTLYRGRLRQLDARALRRGRTTRLLVPRPPQGDCEAHGRGWHVAASDTGDYRAHDTQGDRAVHKGGAAEADGRNGDAWSR